MGSAGESAAAAPGRHVDRLALTMPADPDRLHDLRERFCAFLTAHRIGEQDVFDLVVAVSEAVANAIEHPVRRADMMIDVTAELLRPAPDAAAREVLVSVHDNGRWRPSSPAGDDPDPTNDATGHPTAEPNADPAPPRGRGLLLIGALTDAEVRTEAGGTTLTLRRRLDAGD